MITYVHATDSGRADRRSVGDTHHAGVVTFHRLSDTTPRIMIQLDWEPDGLAEKAGDRAAAAIVILVIASIVVSQVWLGMIPITEWDGTGTFDYPFPFGSVELEATPMLMK